MAASADKKNVVEVAGQGEGGFEEMKAALDDSRVMFAFVRLVRLALGFLCGAKVSATRRLAHC